MISFKNSLRFFLLFSICSFANAATYNVADFKVAGLTTGDPEAGVHSKIADYFSIDSDELKLIETVEKPSRNGNAPSRENRKYEYGDFLVSVSLVPNYVDDENHKLVVSGVRFEPKWGVDKAIYLAFIERVQGEYTAQHGESSFSTKGSDPRLLHHYWCTAMTDHNKWPCVLKEPHVYLHQLWVTSRDETYRSAYSDADR